MSLIDSMEKDEARQNDSTILLALESFRNEVLDKLGNLENRLSDLGDRQRRLEERSIGCKCCARLCYPELFPEEENRAASPVFPNDITGSLRGGGPELAKDGSPYFIENGTVLLTSLNSFSSFPNGAWLGDEAEPKRRVRVPIDPKTMLSINSTFRTPEKMALKLLDLLFDRDVQANSNLSGSSKYGKQKLNPVFIYGILCHLVHTFKITQGDWDRIKLSIDSKCRTAFRRKRKAQELESIDDPGPFGGPVSKQDSVGGIKMTGEVLKPVEAEEPTMSSQEDVNSLLRPPFELNDLLAGHTDPSDHTRNDRDELPLNTDVPDEIIPVSEGFLEVVYVSPEHMMTLQQTHKIQMQPDGSILAMPIEEEHKEPDKT